MRETTRHLSAEEGAPGLRGKELGKEATQRRAPNPKRSLGSFVLGLKNDQRGVALPAAILILALVLVLGGVAVSQSVSALSGSRQDAKTKAAVAAAQSGGELALWRINTLSGALNDPLAQLTCLGRVNGNLSLVQAEVILGQKWCPAVTEELGGGESFSYRISDLAAINLDDLDSTLDREIIATGTSQGVTRRIIIRSSALDVTRLFGDYTVFSTNPLSLSNQADVGSPGISGNARSNGDILLNHSGAVVYGNATPGPGHTVSGPGHANGSTAAAASPLILPSVTMPSGSATDTLSCKTGLLFLSNCSNAIWNAATRRLDVTSGSVKVFGNTLSICSLHMANNSTLIFSPTSLTKPVRLFIDSPQNCRVAGSPPANSILLENNPKIQVDALNGLLYPIVQVYVVGDQATPTQIRFSNNNTDQQPLLIFAPDSQVILENNGTIKGGIAARQVTMSNNTVVLSAAGQLGSLISLVKPIYKQIFYNECAAKSPAAGQAPDQGC